MNHVAAVDPVVVGIDGSRAALNAAVWAIDEALHRDVPLRLVHVIATERDSAAAADVVRLEVEYAESVLRSASAAVVAVHAEMKIETDILWGSVDGKLVDESRGASMICLGSVGIDWIAKKLLGSTAASVAEAALCPVAVIRYPPGPLDEGDWVVVAFDDAPDNDLVVSMALEEAELRGNPVLAVGGWRADYGELRYDELDRRVADCQVRFPRVHIHPVCSHQSLVSFLAQNSAWGVRLVVIGSDDAGRLAAIVGRNSSSPTVHGECSVLVAR